MSNMDWSELVETIQKNWVSIINNTPSKDKWSFIPNDQGYRPGSYEAFYIPNKGKNKKSTTTKPITWSNPNCSITNTLYFLYSQDCISGIDDYVMFIPQTLDDYLLRYKKNYVEDASIKIQPVFLEEHQRDFSGHILLIDPLVFEVSIQAIVVKVDYPYINYIDLYGPQ